MVGRKSPALSVRREKRLEEEALRRLRQIYLKSFSRSERMDFRSLLRRISEGKEWLFAARTEGQLVGFAVTMPLPGTEAHFLEYLAVAPRFRNHGVGSALLAAVGRKLRAAADASGLILEVKPENHTTGENRGLRGRRIEFYRRNGARMVECAPHYRAPDMRGEGSLVYRLMWLPLSETARTPCGPALRLLIRSIFVHGYGREEDDALLREVLVSVLPRPGQSERARE